MISAMQSLKRESETKTFFGFQKIRKWIKKKKAMCEITNILSERGTIIMTFNDLMLLQKIQ